MENFEHRNSPRRNVETEHFFVSCFTTLLNFLSHARVLHKRSPPQAFPRCTLSCTARERGRGTFTLHLRRTKILTVDDTSVLLNKFDAFAPAPLITISGRNLARDATMLFLNQLITGGKFHFRWQTTPTLS